MLGSSHTRAPPAFFAFSIRLAVYLLSLYKSLTKLLALQINGQPLGTQVRAQFSILWGARRLNLQARVDVYLTGQDKTTSARIVFFGKCDPEP